MLKNKRILFIFTLILIAILSIPLKSFCTTDSNTDTSTGFSTDEVKIIENMYKQYSSKYNSYVCRYHAGEITMYLYDNSSDLFFFVSNGDLYSSIKCSPYYVNFTTSGVIKNEGQGSYNQVYAHADGKPNIYSNRDVYSGASKDVVFFQAPPQGILAPIVEGTKMETTLQEVIHLLPLIIVVVVSFLGLRKALRTLSKVLHQS